MVHDERHDDPHDDPHDNDTRGTFERATTVTDGGHRGGSSKVTTSKKPPAGAAGPSWKFGEQLELLPREPAWLTHPSSRIEREFAAFHRANPTIYNRLEMLCVDAMRKGATRISVYELSEYLRMHVNIPKAPGAEYKVNNSYRPLYARLLIHNVPALAALIETRSRREKRRGAE